MIYSRPIIKKFDVPVMNHYGAFGVKRKYEHHSGVDIYTKEGTPVFAIEGGKIVEINNFTGPEVKSPWWNPTRSISIEGDTGVIVYGEIQESNSLKVGMYVKIGHYLGDVKQVLKHDKGKPMSMLHIQLLEHGWRDVDIPVWKLDMKKPNGLLDPTLLLLHCRECELL